jgi:hypothetical protein
MILLYRNLEIAILDKGIKKKTIAEKLSISPKALANKLRGITDFSWSECCLLQKEFFPSLDKDYLFATENDKAS